MTTKKVYMQNTICLYTLQSKSCNQSNSSIASFNNWSLFLNDLFFKSLTSSKTFKISSISSSFFSWLLSCFNIFLNSLFLYCINQSSNSSFSSFFLFSSANLWLFDIAFICFWNVLYFSPENTFDIACSSIYL